MGSLVVSTDMKGQGVILLPPPIILVGSGKAVQ